MRSIKTPLTVAALLALLTAGSAMAGSKEEGTPAPIGGFPDASLTVFPVALNLSGPVDQNQQYRAFADAFRREFHRKAGELASTFGLLLEERGYGRCVVDEAAFAFPAGAVERQERGAAFGDFVRESGLETDYALGIEFTLDLERSWQETYAVLVDADGNAVWEDRQGPGDRAFEEDFSGTELGRLELVCSRFMAASGLDRLPTRELAADKRQALDDRRAKEPPSPREFKAMENRVKAAKDAGAAARALVYPARVGGDHVEPACATRLSGLLNDAKLWQATPAREGPAIEGSGWPNEMQVLWLFARNAREYVREHPADSDYVLFADYWFDPRGEVWAVHSVVCDRAGEWVVVDMQNSHQPDFRRIRPRTLKDCDRLVLERVKACLR